MKCKFGLKGCVKLISVLGPVSADVNSSTRSVLHCSYLKWPLHVRPPPPEYDGAEEGEAVEGPDGEAEEVDQGSHVAEHEQDRERALKKEGVRV